MNFFRTNEDMDPFMSDQQGFGQGRRFTPQGKQGMDRVGDPRSLNVRNRRNRVAQHIAPPVVTGINRFTKPTIDQQDHRLAKAVAVNQAAKRDLGFFGFIGDGEVIGAKKLGWIAFISLIVLFAVSRR